MGHRFLNTSAVIFGIISFSLTSDLFASAIDQVQILNENISLARKNGGPIHALAKKSAALLSGKSSCINFNHYANDAERDIARDSIFNAVIGDYQRGQKTFSLKDKTYGDMDQRYVGHMAFIALNHIAVLELLNHRQGFLYTSQQLIEKLLVNRLKIFDTHIKVKDQALKGFLRQAIGNYGKKMLGSILGENVMERYLDLSRNYKDVKDQWLVQVRDIKEHPSEEGHIKTQNQQDFYFKNNSVIAVDIKNPEEFEDLIPFDSYVHYKNQHFLPYNHEVASFAKTTNNFSNPSLLYNILPDEILCHIASSLTMKDLISLNSVSQRSNRVVRSLISRTNLLTSNFPYAKQIMEIFKDVQIEPRPQKIQLLMYAKTEKGSIEIHFRDSQHLRKIVEEMPLINASGKLYFVKDSDIEDGQELIAPEDGLQTGCILRFISDTPLTLKGNLNGRVPYGMYLPQRSKWTELVGTTKGISCSKGFKSFIQANELADTLDTFNPELFKSRTSEAHALLRQRKSHRLQHPGLYPDFFQKCPNSNLISFARLDISQKDYISSKKPLIYFSPSLNKLKELKRNLPEFATAIYFINPESNESGLYSLGALNMDKGFRVSSEGNIISVGEMLIPDHNLKLTSKGSIWHIGSLEASNITIKSGNSIYAGGLFDLFMNEDGLSLKKPQDMRVEEWVQLLSFYYPGLFNYH